MPVSNSPLRYPGGKTAFTPFIAKVIEHNARDRYRYAETFAEPYAGGAGAGLRLLFEGRTARLLLNDIDPRVHAFWLAVTNENERFCKRIAEVPLLISEWKRQQEIVANPEEHDVFTLGFATFFLNRTNYCGVLYARPIGGLAQTGKYLMDARFNRKNLVKRVLRVGGFADRISVANLPAPDFVRSLDEKCFIYLDPPYNGKRLYMKLDGQDEEMSRTLREVENPWLMTHGETNAYAWASHSEFVMPYSFMADRKKGKENIYYGNLELP